MFYPSTEFTSPIGKYAKKGDIVFFKEENYPIIEKVCSYKGVFTGIEFGKSYPGMGIYKGLLINSSYSFKCAYIESVLRA